MKKFNGTIFLSLIIGVSLACLLSGCDKKSGSAKSGLELFSTKPENVGTMQKLADGFMKENPDITVTVSAPADPGMVLRSRLAKNDIPDVIAIGGDSNYTLLADNGILLDLSGQAFLSQINPGYQNMLYDIQKDRAKIPYGVPYATNGSGVLYNKDLFAQYNVNIPESWDDFIAAAGTFKAAGVNPFLLTFADTWTTLPIWNSTAPAYAPSGFADELLAGTAVFSGSHEEILKKYLEILEYCGNDYMGTGYNDGNIAFANGNAAMMVNGNWAIPEFIKAKAGMNVGLFAFPATNDINKNTVTSGVDVALVVSASGKKREASLKFVEFMLRKENALQYIKEQFAFSAVLGVEQDDPTVQDLRQVIAAGRVSDFIDHSYPSGFDLAAILSRFALNKRNGMESAQNIRETLVACDSEYKALK